MAKTKDDMNVTVDAFFNFIGHHTNFSQLSIDQLCKKAILYELCERIIEIYENHTSLLYFPHPDVTISLL